MVSRVEPAYNAAARHDGVAGVVIVEARIDAAGKVRDAVILTDLHDQLGQNDVPPQ